MTPIWMAPSATLLLGYALGSIPFGLVLTRLFGGGDLRTIGSGNIGATNVLRTGRKGLAAATLALDLLKGAVAVLLARAITPEYAPLGAVGAFLGHCYPIWLHFKGGKGVATYAGIALALCWPAGLAYAAAWIAGLAATRISSVGGLAAALVAPIAAAIAGETEASLLFVALSLIVVWKHRANVARLVRGEEPRVGTTNSA